MEHNDISTRVIKEYAVQNRINHFKFSYCTIFDYKEHVIKSFKGKRMLKTKFPICVAKWFYTFCSFFHFGEEDIHVCLAI